MTYNDGEIVNRGSLMKSQHGQARPFETKKEIN